MVLFENSIGGSRLFLQKCVSSTSRCAYIIRVEAIRNRMQCHNTSNSRQTSIDVFASPHYSLVSSFKVASKTLCCSAMQLH